MKRQQIDKVKLRAAMRRLPDGSVYQMLDEAIDLLPPTKLAKLLKSYIALDEVRTDSEVTETLLDAVRRFQKESLAGRYYQSFNVNSKNYREMSKGTRVWIADCTRLLGDCVKAVSRKQHQEARQAFEILFDLLRKIDEDPDSIVFFADEAGAWQVGCDWRTIMPAWFKCLSATAADPAEYAAEVIRSVHDLVGYDHDKHLAVAARVATSDQRRVLKARTEQARG
ncbi:MAG: hypothetical protein JXR37_30380 [Kiritimatiellae bacterium]|nr:hypothetical protein [Kiritimatiellia bacterium]